MASALSPGLGTRAPLWRPHRWPGAARGRRAVSRASSPPPPPSSSSSVAAAAAAAAVDPPAGDSQTAFGDDPGRPQRVAVMVEPSPFSHVCGYKNRFQSMIKHLRENNDSVLVITPDEDPPAEYFGARVLGVGGFRFPFYNIKTMLLSPGISFTAFKALWDMKPDIIHVSSPGFLVFAAILYAKVLNVPLVVSYHTHVPHYIPLYTFAFLVAPMWAVIRFCHACADLTLVTSKQLKQQLEAEGCHSGHLDVWRRGVDTDVFSPKFSSAEMRERMSGGHPGDPLLCYVGRLGEEKQLDDISAVLDAVPNSRLALVGDGPSRADLEAHYSKPEYEGRVVFMGMMGGEELSQAYASCDIFVMPSESETLGFVVIEAMASGVPVVAVRAGGIPDLISDGRTGLFYTPGDLQECARHVSALLADEPRAREMANAARKEVEKWGWRDATNHLRNYQYNRARKRFEFKRRNWRMLLKVGLAAAVRRTLLGLFRVIFGPQGRSAYDAVTGAVTPRSSKGAGGGEEGQSQAKAAPAAAVPSPAA